MKVVVTGSSGLLGRHVAAAFVERGAAVLGIDMAPPAAPHHPFVAADVTDLGALAPLVRGADVLVHAAAIPRPTGRDPGTVFRTNVTATYAAVEAAALLGIARFVYASSFSVLGYPFFERAIAPASFPVDESHAVGAQDAYAVSKWLGEEIVEAAVRRGALAEAVSLRMPWIQTPESFAREVVPRRRTTEAWRDLWAYLDARDAADAFVAAAEQPLAGHHRLFLSAEDTYSPEPTEALARQHYRDVAFSRPIHGCGALIDTAAARVVLGWAPRRSWRAYPLEETP